MGTNKYIYLIILFLLPMLAMAQQKSGSKRSGVYVVSTGDTTQIVNPVRIGTKNPESRFLNRSGNPITDSIYDGISSNYSKLEESTLELYKLLEDVEKNQPAATTGNTALQYKISVEASKRLREEKLAKAKADSMKYARQAMSADELAENLLKYGHQPTYYINGVEVDSNMVNQILSQDILERNVKAENTASGNPNGEIWFKIKDKAAYNLGLPLYSGRIPTDEEFREVDYRDMSRNKQNENLRQRVEQQPTVVKEDYSNRQFKKANPVRTENAAAKEQTQQKPPVKVEAKKDSTAQQPARPRTRVRARTVNNQKVEVIEEYHPTAE